MGASPSIFFTNTSVHIHTRVYCLLCKDPDTKLEPQFTGRKINYMVLDLWSSNRLLKTHLKSKKGLTEWSEWRECVLSTRCMSGQQDLSVWYLTAEDIEVVSAPADYSADWGHENQSHNVPDSCWLHQAIGGKKGWQREGLVWLF